jgi:hypothetical protein
LIITAEEGVPGTMCVCVCVYVCVCAVFCHPILYVDTSFLPPYTVHTH